MSDAASGAEEAQRPRPLIVRVVDALDTGASTIGAIILFAVMCIVMVDVGMRYVFNSPLAWSYDLISMYLMVSIFYLTLSETLRRGHHVPVDLWYRRFAKPWRQWWRLVGWLLTSVFFTIVCYLTGKGAISRFEGGDVMAGSIPWPTWIAHAVVAFGAGLIALRLAIGCVGLAIALTTRRPDPTGVSEIDFHEPEDL